MPEGQPPFPAPGARLCPAAGARGRCRAFRGRGRCRGTASRGGTSSTSRPPHDAIEAPRRSRSTPGPSAPRRSTRAWRAPRASSRESPTAAYRRTRIRLIARKSSRSTTPRATPRGSRFDSQSAGQTSSAPRRPRSSYDLTCARSPESPGHDRLDARRLGIRVASDPARTSQASSISGSAHPGSQPSR